VDLRVGSVCDRGLSQKRPVNEDRCLVLEDRGLFVVCDGVGGHNSGEVASQLAVDTIEEAAEHLDGADAEESLKSAVRYANRDIFEMASSNVTYQGMGTTVALLYLDRERGRAVIGHAGDSRVYRFDGTLHRETYDHTDLDDALRAGHISRQQALQLGKQNTINRALGIEADVAAEFKTIDLAGGEAFLLCSDGVTRHVDDEELEDLFAASLEPDALCEEIRSRCYARGAEDNLTAVVVYTGAPRPARPAGVRPAVSRQRIDFERQVERRPTPSGTTASPVRPALLLCVAVVLGVTGFFAGRSWSRWFTDAPPIPPAVAARDALERGDAASARATFERLAAAEPQRADYQYWLGRSCLRLGDAREAARRFEESARLDGPPDTYLYLAAAYESDGRSREAAEALRRYAAQAAPTAPTSSAAPSAAASSAR
jgi:protein phosphatase